MIELFTFRRVVVRCHSWHDARAKHACVVGNGTTRPQTPLPRAGSCLDAHATKRRRAFLPCPSSTMFPQEPSNMLGAKPAPKEKRPYSIACKALISLVRARGFEPPTTCTPYKKGTNLPNLKSPPASRCSHPSIMKGRPGGVQ